MRKTGYIAAGILIGSSLAIATTAVAGGFAIREQSTTGLGLAFADSAAGSDLSSMYWNPAAVTTQDGLNSLSSFTAIIPDTEIDPTVGTSAQIGTLGLLAGSYYNYQLNQRTYVGVSINAPFGLVTDADDRFWGGDNYARKSEMLTFNVAPTAGYKITPNLSVAVGLQVQYIKVRLSSANPFVPANDIVIKGDDIAAGFTAGVLYKSDFGTSIGLGYRSTIKHKLEGVMRGHPDTRNNGDINAGFDTPEIVTASVRQELSPTIAVMLNYEWTNWSRMKELRVKQDDGVGTDVVDDFSWKDSWFISGGSEIKMSEKFTGRFGLGYEKSPVPDETRGARLPDSDRVWLSFGGSYKWSDSTTLDFGYSHIFFEDAKIDLTDAVKGNLVADVTNSANIISLGLRHKW